jgi:esterase/lipase superfamily enzyme
MERVTSYRYIYAGLFVLAAGVGVATCVAWRSVQVMAPMDSTSRVSDLALRKKDLNHSEFDEARHKHVAASEEPDVLVDVFYGTDRAAVSSLDAKAIAPGYRLAVVAAISSLVLVAIGLRCTGEVTKRTVVWTCSVLVGLAAVALWLQAIRTGRGSIVKYGPERGEVTYGVCQVRIPRDHRLGDLETPSLLRLEFSADPTKHVILEAYQEYEGDRFFSLLKDAVTQSRGASEKSQALVFVHGFNNSFEDAARRTAQLAYDLKYEGVPIIWSWPSQRASLAYTYDETNVRWTEPHLEQFLRDVAERSGADTIHLVAHSMGNRCLTEALKRLASGTGVPASVREVILTAPDIDAETFRTDIAPKIVGAGRRVTLYASSNDEALKLSKRIAGYQRAGDVGDGIVIVPPLETIDVSSVDTSLFGHAYYGDNTSVIFDLFQLLQGKKPSERFGLREESFDGQSYWVFQPTGR